MLTQQEIDAIWQNAKDGKYEVNLPGVIIISPEIIVDDKQEQVISIQNQDGTARVVYRREPGRQWESV